MFEHKVYPDPVAHLAAEQPTGPTMYFAPGVLRRQAERFQTGFDGQVTYAVKANPATEVLGTLAASGISGFDVASPAEIGMVRQVSQGADLHYNNPVRTPGEIEAGRAAGVKSWSVDEITELDKLGPPAFAGEEVSVRLKLPVKGAHYDFGAKFGAERGAAVRLLQEVSARGYTPAMCFHAGTQCDAPEAWAAYIHASADVAREAGVEITRLNVGGGFASHRGGPAPDLDRVFRAIRQTTGEAFGKAPELVCEPGRAMVAESFVLAVQVKALRADESVFINDGIYGALAEWRDITPITRISALGHDGTARRGAVRPRRVFGPTCDSLDCLPDPVSLPEDLEPGDYLLFKGMGAYSLAIATRFNGYGPGGVVTVQNV
ncbi:type III PLP-dependent enzyme [Rhodobacteraceae bacterium 63075]|nr:type III PLP-dependent enzyme [Rhodobacteraceae bacterium 63075]